MFNKKLAINQVGNVSVMNAQGAADFRLCYGSDGIRQHGAKKPILITVMINLNLHYTVIGFQADVICNINEAKNVVVVFFCIEINIVN